MERFRKDTQEKTFAIPIDVLRRRKLTGVRIRTVLANDEIVNGVSERGDLQ
jgi:hypothetical protein